MFLSGCFEARRIIGALNGFRTRERACRWTRARRQENALIKSQSFPRGHYLAIQDLLQVSCRDARVLRLKGARSSSARGPRLRKPGISTLGSAPARSVRGANCRTSAGTTGILLTGMNEDRAGSSWAIESLEQKPLIGRGVRMWCGYLYFS
jgi:hypothetical protein